MCTKHKKFTLCQPVTKTVNCELFIPKFKHQERLEIMECHLSRSILYYNKKNQIKKYGVQTLSSMKIFLFFSHLLYIRSWTFTIGKKDSFGFVRVTSLVQKYFKQKFNPVWVSNFVFVYIYIYKKKERERERERERKEFKKESLDINFQQNKIL